MRRPRPRLPSANCARAPTQFGSPASVHRPTRPLPSKNGERRKLKDPAAQRLQAITRRGESVWREIEAEIERRNTTSYDKAAGLLIDLQAIAEEKGVTEDFVRRLQMVRERHARKERFIERLAKFG